MSDVQRIIEKSGKETRSVAIKPTLLSPVSIHQHTLAHCFPEFANPGITTRVGTERSVPGWVAAARGHPEYKDMSSTTANTPSLTASLIAPNQFTATHCIVDRSPQLNTPLLAASLIVLTRI